jgi:hypothetical protein
MFSTGFGDLDTKLCTATLFDIRYFFLDPNYGGCVWETLVSAGIRLAGSPTRTQLPPLLFGDDKRQLFIKRNLGTAPWTKTI